VGPLSTLLALPIRGPIGALTWLARQVADAAVREMLDPVRIEAALLALERRLDAGEIDEAAFEAEETRLLEELAEMRAWRARIAEGQTDEQADEDPAGDQPPVEQQAGEEQADPQTDARQAAAAAADPAVPASGEAGAWTPA
jgi:hypothetical protein